MPWKSSDAQRHNKKANTPQDEKIWSDVANKVLKDSGDEAKAIRIANSVLKKKRHAY